MQFSVHTAKSQLSRLIDAALRGEEVIIAKGSKPVARLVALPQNGFKLGIMSKPAGTDPDFLQPLDADDLDLWEGQGAP